MHCVGIMLVSRKGIKQPTEEVSTQLLRTLDFDVNEWMTSVPSKCHTIEPNPLWNRQIRQFHEISFPKFSISTKKIKLRQHWVQSFLRRPQKVDKISQFWTDIVVEVNIQNVPFFTIASKNLAFFYKKQNFHVEFLLNIHYKKVCKWD